MPKGSLLGTYQNVMTSHPLYLGDVPPSKVLCGFFLIYHPDAFLQKGTGNFFSATAIHIKPVFLKSFKFE